MMHQMITEMLKVLGISEKQIAQSDTVAATLVDVFDRHNTRGKYGRSLECTIHNLVVVRVTASGLAILIPTRIRISESRNRLSVKSSVITNQVWDNGNSSYKPIELFTIDIETMSVVGGTKLFLLDKQLEAEVFVTDNTKTIPAFENLI